MDEMLYIMLLIAIVCAPAFYVILGRPRFVPLADKDLAKARVSILIPARNEEANIARLLKSIVAQKMQPYEIIVIDDESSDGTARVAGEYAARVIDPAKKPEDWNGKSWACYQGAQVAAGDWLLFLDADTQLMPGAMEKITALTIQKDRTYSICPYHTIQRPYEQLSAFFNFVMVAGVNAFGLYSNSAKDIGLFGQVLLISKPHYKAVRGHESVKGEVLENLQLAHYLRKIGVKCECYLGKGTVIMRMFPGGFRDLWASWKKAFFTQGAGNTAPRALLLISIWITGAMSALVGILLAAAPLASDAFRISALGVYLIYVLLCLRGFKLVGSFSSLNAIIFPVSLLFYQTLFLTSIVEKRLGIKTQWKGRDVD